MAWRALVSTDTQLARCLGVSRQAIAQAEERGVLVRMSSGRWDAVEALHQWRDSVNPLLQRRSPVFRPWLDNGVPLVPSVWDEFVRRVDEAGAEWRRSRGRARDDDDDE
jgi:hypothetical protein